MEFHAVASIQPAAGGVEPKRGSISQETTQIMQASCLDLQTNSQFTKGVQWDSAAQGIETRPASLRDNARELRQVNSVLVKRQATLDRNQRGCGRIHTPLVSRMLRSVDRLFDGWLVVTVAKETDRHLIRLVETPRCLRITRRSRRSDR